MCDHVCTCIPSQMNYVITKSRNWSDSIVGSITECFQHLTQIKIQESILYFVLLSWSYCMYIACPALECTTYETGDTSSQQYKAIRKKNCSLFCFWCLYLCSWKFCLSHPKYVGHIEWRPHQVEATSSGGHIKWRPHQVQVWNMVDLQWWSQLCPL